MTLVLLTVAGLYSGLLLLKSALALRYARGVPPSGPVAPSRVTLLQAIVSGDSNLSATLESSLLELRTAGFLWLVDAHDAPAKEICRRLIVRFPESLIEIIEVPEPPQGVNPKSHKLRAALPRVRTDFLAVVDDDTRPTLSGLSALIGGLEAGALLSTGLPSYAPAGGVCSRCLAEFVNSAAILTYLPVLAVAEPVTINGMCYAMRTGDARNLDVFAAIERCLTDDLAVAKLVRRSGGRIFQSTQPQFISTTVASPRALCRLMHRWFVCTRLLVEGETRTTRLGIMAGFGLPPLLLWVLVVGGVFTPALLPAFVAAMLLRSGIIVALQRRFIGRISHRPLLSLLMEMACPVFLAGAYVNPVVWWRKRRIRVQAAGRFQYL